MFNLNSIAFYCTLDKFDFILNFLAFASFSKVVGAIELNISELEFNAVAFFYSRKPIVIEFNQSNELLLLLGTMKLANVVRSYKIF